MPATVPFMLVGDFNARTGSLQSQCELGLTSSRLSDDGTVCPRGAWLLELCTTLDLIVLNGV